MADAAINPNFTQEEFDKEKEKIDYRTQSTRKRCLCIASRVQGVLGYGRSHPKGEFTTEETVNNVALIDIEEFYRNYFVPATPI